MKHVQLIILTLLLSYSIIGAQSIGMGTATPDASAQLEISTSTKGILIPRMNTTAVNSIANPAKGLMVYDTTKNELMVNMGTAGTPDWRSIAYNSHWGVDGNAGTDPLTHFIGTTDNASLIFKVRNRLAGKIDSLSAHTFFGYKAGLNCSPGAIFNTAVGNNTFVQNTTGHTNTAVGAYALNSNTTGMQNSAFGVNALKNNTVNNFNVAFGYRALENNAANSNSAFGNGCLANNTTGFANTAIGSNALPINSTGSLNVAVGRLAMLSNTTGYNNTGLGAAALNDNTTGFYNAALGDASLEANTVGAGNTACGSGALFATVQSSYNTSLGYHAGFDHNLGWNNTLIGANCNVTASGIFNGIGVGEGTVVTASSQARIGNSAVSSIGGFANWSNISDGRYKKNIREDVKGLDFIMKLRPVTYQLDVTSLHTTLNEPDTNLGESGMELAIAQKESQIQSGFIAQEVEQAAQELGYDFSGVDKPKNENDLYALRYAEFVVPLVKAVQEQQSEIRNLRTQNEELLRRIEQLER